MLGKTRFLSEIRRLESDNIADVTILRQRCGALTVKAEHSMDILKEILKKALSSGNPLVLLEIIVHYLNPASKDEQIVFLDWLERFLDQRDVKRPEQLDCSVERVLYSAVAKAIPPDALDEIKNEAHIILKRDFLKRMGFLENSMFPWREFVSALLHVLTKANAQSSLMYLSIFDERVEMISVVLDSVRYNDKALTILAKEIISNASDVNISMVECVLLLFALSRFKFVKDIAQNFCSLVKGLSKEALVETLGNEKIINDISHGLQITVASLANAGAGGGKRLEAEYTMLLSDLLYEKCPSVRIPLFSTLLTLASEGQSVLERREPLTIRLALRICAIYRTELLQEFGDDVLDIVLHTIRKGEDQCGAEVTHGICRVLAMLSESDEQTSTIYSIIHKSLSKAVGSMSGGLRKDTSLMLAAQMIKEQRFSYDRIYALSNYVSEILDETRQNVDNGFLFASYSLDLISSTSPNLEIGQFLKSHLVPSLNGILVNSCLISSEDSIHGYSQASTEFHLIDQLRSRFFEGGLGKTLGRFVHIRNDGFLGYFGVLWENYLKCIFKKYGGTAIQSHLENLQRIGTKEYSNIRVAATRSSRSSGAKDSGRAMVALFEEILWLFHYLHFLITFSNTVYEMYDGSTAGNRVEWKMICGDSIAKMLPFAKDLNEKLTQLTHEVAGSKQSTKRKKGSIHENDKDFKVIFELLASIPRLRTEMCMQCFIETRSFLYFVDANKRNDHGILSSKRSVQRRKEDVYGLLDSLELLQLILRELEGVSNQSWLPFVKHLRANAPVHSRAHRVNDEDDLGSELASDVESVDDRMGPIFSGKEIISSQVSSNLGSTTSIYGRRKVLVGSSEPYQFVASSVLSLDSAAEGDLLGQIIPDDTAGWFMRSIGDVLRILQDSTLTINHRKIFVQILDSLLAVVLAFLKRNKTDEFCGKLIENSEKNQRVELFRRFEAILNDVENKFASIFVIEILYELADGRQDLDLLPVLQRCLKQHYEDEYLPSWLHLPLSHAPRLRTRFGQQSLRTFSSSMSHKESYKTRSIEYIILTYFSLLDGKEHIKWLLSFFEAVQSIVTAMENNNITEETYEENSKATCLAHAVYGGINSGNLPAVLNLFLYLSSSFSIVHAGSFEEYLSSFRKFLLLHRRCVENGTVKPSVFVIRLMSSYISFLRAKLNRLMRIDGLDMTTTGSIFSEILSYAKQLCNDIRTDKQKVSRKTRRAKRGESGFIPALMKNIEALEQVMLMLTGRPYEPFTKEGVVSMYSVEIPEKNEKGRKRDARTRNVKQKADMSVHSPIHEGEVKPPLKRLKLESTPKTSNAYDLEMEWLGEFETREYDSMYYETEDEISPAFGASTHDRAKDIKSGGFEAHFYDTDH